MTDQDQGPHHQVSPHHTTARLNNNISGPDQKPDLLRVKGYHVQNHVATWNMVSALVIRPTTFRTEMGGSGQIIS